MGEESETKSSAPASVHRKKGRAVHLSIGSGAWTFGKTALWVGLIVAVLVWLHRPLRLTADELPMIIHHANTISVGAWTIKTDAAFEDTVPPEIKTGVDGLGSQDVRRLLALGNDGLTNCQQPGASYIDDKEADDMLARRKLAIMVDQPTMNKPPYSFCYSVAPTPLGHDTQAFLIKFIYGFLSGDNRKAI